MRFLTTLSCPVIVLNVYQTSFVRKTSILYVRGTNLDSSISIDWVNTKPRPVVTERFVSSCGKVRHFAVSRPGHILQKYSPTTLRDRKSLKCCQRSYGHNPQINNDHPSSVD